MNPRAVLPLHRKVSRSLSEITPGPSSVPKSLLLTPASVSMFGHMCFLIKDTIKLRIPIGCILEVPKAFVLNLGSPACDASGRGESLSFGLRGRKVGPWGGSMWVLRPQILLSLFHFPVTMRRAASIASSCPATDPKAGSTPSWTESSHL